MWGCHSERSEESLNRLVQQYGRARSEMFRFAQHDTEKRQLIRVIREARGCNKVLCLFPLDVLVYLFFKNLEGQRAVFEDGIVKLALIEFFSQFFLRTRA